MSDQMILSGSLSNGQIIIDADENAKIQLVLDNAAINCGTSAAIYVRQADKVFVTLASGSENTLSNTSDFVAIDDNNIDGVITLDAGTDGIHSENANKDGKGFIYIAGGDINIEADSDGNVVISYSPEKAYNSVVISCPDLKEGKAYTLKTGDVTNTVTMSSLIYGEDDQMRR